MLLGRGGGGTEPPAEESECRGRDSREVMEGKGQRGHKVSP